MVTDLLGGQVSSVILDTASLRPLAQTGKAKVLAMTGAQRATVAAIFNVQGCVLGLTGIALGGVAGCLLAVELPGLVARIEDLTGLRIFAPELFFISRGWSGDVSAECRSRRNKDRAVSQYSWLRKPAVQHVLCCRVIHSLPA